MPIKSFLENEFDNFVFSVDYQIKSEMESKGKSYILNVDEEKYIEYFYQKFCLIPLKIYLETEEYDEPLTITETHIDSRYGSEYERDVYKFTIKYRFEGSP